MKKFNVTEKDSHKGRKKPKFKYQIPFIVMIILSVIGIINCIKIILISSVFGPIVVLFWLLNNFFFIVMAMFFVSGRASQRKESRVIVNVNCSVSDDAWSVDGNTVDVSESGIAVVLDKPYYFNEGDEMFVEMNYMDYTARPKVQLLKASKRGKEWIYSFKILDYNESYDDLLGIMYDRETTLPNRLKKASGFLDDLKINVSKRTETLVYQKRNSPRITINRKFKCNEPSGLSVNVYDFNYYYVTVKVELEHLKEFTFDIVEGVSLECSYEKAIHNGLKLYRVNNAKYVYANEKTRRNILDKLTAETKIGKDTIETIKEEKTKTEFNDSDVI
jgi:cellulose synthase (UDP-forming)